MACARVERFHNKKECIGFKSCVFVRMVSTIMYCVVYFLYFMTLFMSVFGTEYVPLLIWESSKASQREIPTPPFLKKLSSDYFSDYLMKRLSSHNSKMEPVIAVFIEENLSIEDFSCKVEGYNSFPQLEVLISKASKVEFLPSVHDPLEGLKRLGYRWQVCKSINSTEDYLPDESGVVLIVKLEYAEVERNRPDLLRRHDHTINNIYSNMLAKYPYVVGLYTSHHSAWVECNKENVRRTRNLLAIEGAAKAKKPTFWHDKDKSIFLYTPVYPTLNRNSSNVTEAIHLTGGESNRDDRAAWQCLIVRFTITPSCKVVLRLIFSVSYSSYWSLSEIEFEENDGTTALLKTSTNIYAPLGFSYHCGPEIVFRNGAITLNFSHVQIQPYLKEPKFGDSYDCVLFFTIPICSGLMFTAILVFVMIWALNMIMGIKTMDHFDDPKGKTITIIVSE